MAIAEVADKTGVSAHALHYYERIGLLDVGRQAGGHRRYTGADVARVVFVTRLRATAMPIREIQRYFALVAEGRATEHERLALLEAHRSTVRSQLRELSRARRHRAQDRQLRRHGDPLDTIGNKRTAGWTLGHFGLVVSEQGLGCVGMSDFYGATSADDP